MKALVLLTAISLISAPTWGDEENEELDESSIVESSVVESPWSGNAKLGFIFSKTNETSMSTNSGASIIYDKDEWQQKGEFSTYYTKGNEDNDGTNKYNLSYGMKHLINDAWFVYTNSKYEHDLYATYRKQLTIATGFGATLIDEEDKTLNIGAGPGYRFSQRQDFDPDLPGKKEDEVIANAFLEGSSKLNDRFELGGEVRVDYGEENTTTNIKGYLKNQLMAQVSLLLDTEYINNSNVAADSSNSEIYSTISLSYDF
ncbi:DUF481 domain-containing protein [Photobacterium proteolyticum]|uniref:DUF481 domain-containing protein n=1 Tax=Photobacterium proteolyticum TaxID=1903952 RepID=UPI0009FB174A|nr:DUF481 domain-containing protein [Photobacterium proteolyticum]